MADCQINPLAAVAANFAIKREQGHVVLGSALWAFDRHVVALNRYR
jgi:hypothetical protein